MGADTIRYPIRVSINPGNPEMISSSKKEFIVEYRPSSIRVARVSALTAPVTIEAIEEISLKGGADAIASAVRKLSGAKSNGYMNGSCVVYPERRVVRKVSIDAPKGKETEFIFSFLHYEIENAPPELAANCLSPETGQDCLLYTSPSPRD